jgi:DNA repair protein RecO (recombination protein O)
MRKRSGPCEATPCLVLRVVDYGDADRIVTLLTAAHGKISALAKGARSSRRRFGAALSSFGFGEAMLEERRGQDLWSLSDLHVTRGFPNLPHELSRFGHAAYACELCLHLCPPHVPEPEVLRLLVTLLDYLDGLPLTDKPSPLGPAHLRAATALGGGPGPAAVRLCRLRRVRFLPRRSCPSTFAEAESCAATVSSALFPASLAPKAADFTRPCATPSPCLAPCRSTAPPSPPSAIEARSQRQARELLQSLIQNHLGHGLRAVEFIAKMNTFGPS